MLSKEDIKFLSQLPYHRHIKREGISFYLAHGSPRDNLFEYVHPGWSDKKLKKIRRGITFGIMVLGHTHIKMELKNEDKLFFEPRIYRSTKRRYFQELFYDIRHL